MLKSTLFRAGAISLALLAFEANAAVINGTNYKQYTGGGSSCPDKSKVLVYKRVKYCKAYRANISLSPPTTRTKGTAQQASELKALDVYRTRHNCNAK